MKKRISSNLITAFILAANWVKLALDGFGSMKRLAMLISATVIYLLMLLCWKKGDNLGPFFLGFGGIILIYLLYLIF